jgi:glutamate 5-kinase
VIVQTCVKLRHDGHHVVLVSSGAIGVGLRRMGLDKRPTHLPQVQALAAIGQCRLIKMWDELFSHYDQPVAQILLSSNDIAPETQFQNAQNTFFQLFDMGIIPIVNENDTLAVAEIKFGDNDTLSAVTAGMVHADFLFLMTDVDCLFDKNPRTNPDAKPIEVVHDIDDLTADVSSKGSSLGTGGMYTKIVAARRATSAGVTTIISRSSRPGNIKDIIDGLANMNGVSKPDIPIHTRFLPAEVPIGDRSFWLLNVFTPRGSIYINEKAYMEIIGRANLSPQRVLEVEGNFALQEAVRIFVVKSVSEGPHHKISPPGTPRHETAHLGAEEVGRAVVNYSSADIKRIMGRKPAEIQNLLGFADSDYVAHRENIELFRTERSRPSTPPVPPAPAVNFVPVI